MSNTNLKLKILKCPICEEELFEVKEKYIPLYEALNYEDILYDEYHCINGHVWINLHEKIIFHSLSIERK
jgi:hypothetical protein